MALALAQPDERKSGASNKSGILKSVPRSPLENEKNDAINPPPLIPCLTNIQEVHIQNAYKNLDLNGNGYVSAAEIRHMLECIGIKPTEEELDEMISLADSTGCGQVNYDGFKSLLVTKDRLTWHPGCNANQTNRAWQDSTAISTAIDMAAPPAKKDQAKELTQDQKAKILKGMKAILHGSSNKNMKDKFQVEGESLDSKKSDDDDEVVFSKGTAEEREEALEAAEKDTQVMEVLLDLGGTAENKLKPSFVKFVHKRFTDIDKDNSGSIDYFEFCEVMGQDDSPVMQRMLKKKFPKKIFG